MKHILLFILLVVYGIPLFGQIQGKVYDAENQAPLDGVHIIHEGKIIAVSDLQGNFSLDNIKSSDTIQFQRLGYQERKKVVGKEKYIMIPMASKSIAIGDVTVRAYNNNQRAFSAPGPLEVLNSKQISALAVTSPEPVLNSMPGLYMHNGAKNTNRITIRGIGSRSMYTTTKIKAYLNEIPLTSGIGETTLEDIDMDLVDRITVLKGPSSSIYGAALGGTILYRMGMPAEDGFSIKQETAVGSNNLLKNSSKIQWKDNKTGVSLSYNKLNDKGFRENDYYKRDGLTALIRHQLTEDLSITYLGRYHRLKAYIPSSISEETFNEDPTKAADNWAAVSGNEEYAKFLNGLSVDIDLTKNLEAKSSFFLKQYNGNEVRPFNILEDQSLTRGTRNLIQWNTSIGAVHITTRAGFEFLYERYKWDIYNTLTDGVQGDKISKHKQNRRNQNYFGAIEASWNKFRITSGLNLNKTGYQYIDLWEDNTDLSDSKEFHLTASPRVGLTYQFSDQFMVYATMSHGFSTPSYEETLNASGYVTGTVKPETGWNREVGFRAKKNRLYFNISGYSISVNDLLVTKRIAEDEFYKINAGETLHNGLEALIRSEWLKTPILKSSVSMSYMFADYRFKDFTDEGNIYDGNTLPGIPEHKVYVQLNGELNMGFYFTANLIWSDSMPMNDANSKYSDTYSRTNIRVGFQRTLSENWHLNIYGGVQNIANNHYASMILINAPSFGGAPPRYYYPAEPRSYIGGVSVSYTFE